MSSSAEQPDRYWFARHSKSIVFLICVLSIVGVYEALSIPVAVLDRKSTRLNSSHRT